jgi:hypothetical protein
MSGAKPLFHQCNFNTLTVKIAFFFYSRYYKTRTCCLKKLSFLGCDIGKHLDDVSKDSYASIFTVKQFSRKHRSFVNVYYTPTQAQIICVNLH